MQVIKSEQVSFWDVDETLVLHKTVHTRHIYDDKGNITELFPRDSVVVKDPIENKNIRLYIHEPMIRLMREEARRGGTIIVWSRGGHEWAASVINALGLQDLVTLVMSKPMVYFDDKPIQEWLPYRVYLEPGTTYKP